MPLGLIIMLAVVILIFLGLLHRVLDRMRLSDRAALAIIALMIVGSFFNLTLIPGRVSINLGGAVIPIAVSIYLLVASREAQEPARAIGAAIAVTVVIYLVGRLMPSEPGQFTIIDPSLAYGIAAGLAGYAVGRSRRASWIAGTSGVVLADIAVAVENSARGIPAALRLGGAGVFDTIVIAGVVAVGLAEIVGEARERVARIQSGSNDNDKQKPDDGGEHE